MVQDRAILNNGRPIVNRIWSIEQHHIQWSWMTLPWFQGHTVIWCWISHKWYEIQILFQWNTNKDLHMPYSAVSFRHFKGPWVT